MSKVVAARAERATRAVAVSASFVPALGTVMRRDLPPKPVVAALAAGITLPGVRTVVPGGLRKDVAEDPRVAAPPFSLGPLSTLCSAGLGLVAHRSTALEPTASNHDVSKV